MDFSDTGILEDKEIKLVLEKIKQADPEKKRVPAYCFLICDKQGNNIGYCDLKTGYTKELYYSGHIAYEIKEEYRGHHYAAKACRLLFRLAKKLGMDHLFITCNPGNPASRNTCEYLGGKLIEIAELPKDHELRTESGHTHECIFFFTL